MHTRHCSLLDPMLATSYPSAILCRERALVVNLEYVKMIVTLGESARAQEWGGGGKEAREVHRRRPGRCT
jgi:hypothetical protein